jgi:hypothetical protein
MKHDLLNTHFPTSHDIGNFLNEYEDYDIDSLRLKANNNPHWQLLIDQKQGQQTLSQRWPSLCQVPGYLLPPLSNARQASSEATATWKAHFLHQAIGSPASWKGLDTTGGSGVDTWAFEQCGANMTVTEPDEHLATMLHHNGQVLRQTRRVIQDKAESLQTGRFDAVFSDPSRLQNGQRVFHPNACEPNAVALMKAWLTMSDHVLIKLSPLLDATEAERLFPQACELIWLSHNREVKELLIHVERGYNGPAKRRIVELEGAGEVRHDSPVMAGEIVDMATEPLAFLIDPYPSVLASRGVNHLASLHGLKRLHPSHSLLTASHIPADFPGRVFRLDHKGKPIKSDAKAGFSVISRGFPQRADQIKSALKCTENEERFLIATLWGNKSKGLLQCTRV